MLSENSKDLYHQDISESYTDDGHFHYERIDKKSFTEIEINDFVLYLRSIQLISAEEVLVILKLFTFPPSEKSFPGSFFAKKNEAKEKSKTHSPVDVPMDLTKPFTF